MGFFDIFKTLEFKNKILILEHEITKLQKKINEMNKNNDELGITSLAESKKAQKDLLDSIRILENKKDNLNQSITQLETTNLTLDKKIKTSTNKLNKSKQLYDILNYATSRENTFSKINEQQSNEIDELCPSVFLQLHCMDMKDLRKAYRENEKQINSVLDTYSKRYTTKSNKAIYTLVVLSLKSELQNILYNLKYEKLDKSIELVKDMTTKYLTISSEGNQTIASTLTKFISEIEYLFINSVKIEYNYYIRKEQARQEQLAIRQQMREEAEERKLLEQQKKQIEKEESKYETEIEKIKEQLLNADNEKTIELNSRILELERQLADVQLKKEEISSLQNGKAGNVYIISNLGSFGDQVFKIGMTRRLEPLDRINELGSASVPFKFDVHSLIFSDDAVELEKQLHTVLHNHRVNKVNMRKEFFNVTLDELENIVTEIQPTAEFTKTMLAEEFRQSSESDVIYDTTVESIYDDDDDIE